jgi:hypothetical protein
MAHPWLQICFAPRSAKQTMANSAPDGVSHVASLNKVFRKTEIAVWSYLAMSQNTLARSRLPMNAPAASLSPTRRPLTNPKALTAKANPPQRQAPLLTKLDKT